MIRDLARIPEVREPQPGSAKKRDVLRLIDRKIIGLDFLIGWQRLVEHVEQVLDARLHLGQYAHTAEFSNHIGNIRRLNREEPSSDMISSFKNYDLGSRLRLLEPPCAIDAGDATTNNCDIDFFGRHICVVL